MVHWTSVDSKKDDVSMRKYQQLVLASLAFVSTALFLFYKHEYDRLRSVLEVLDTFGSGGTRPDCASLLAEQGPIKPFEALPSWKKVGSGYVYSAFYLVTDVGNAEVHLLGFLAPDSQPLSECTVWYDNSKEPMQGKLSGEALEVGDKTSGENSQLVAARFICTLPNADAVPYAVSLIKPDSNRIQLFAYIYNANSANHVPLSNSSAACVLPLSGPYNDRIQLAEYIEFHRLLGVTEFYVYDQGIAPNVMNFLKTFSQYVSIQVTILEWNPPEDVGAATTILVNDCLLRSQASSSIVLVSKVNQLLVPRFHKTLRAVIQDIEEASTNPIAQFTVDVRVFCSEFASDPRALVSRTPLTCLKKTQWQETSLLPVDYLLIKTKAVGSIQNGFQPMFSTKYHAYTVPPEVMLMHWYTKCEELGVKQDSSSKKQHDNVMLKYKDKLMSSDFIQLAGKKL